MPSVDVFRMIETVAVVTVPIFLFWLQRMMRDRDRVQEEIRRNTQDQNVRIASLERTSTIHNIWLGLIANKLNLPTPESIVSNNNLGKD